MTHEADALAPPDAHRLPREPVARPPTLILPLDKLRRRHRLLEIRARHRRAHVYHWHGVGLLKWYVYYLVSQRLPHSVWVIEDILHNSEPF